MFASGSVQVGPSQAKKAQKLMDKELVVHGEMAERLKAAVC
jgi:hypothetical protein